MAFEFDGARYDAWKTTPDDDYDTEHVCDESRSTGRCDCPETQEPDWDSIREAREDAARDAEREDW